MSDPDDSLMSETELDDTSERTSFGLVPIDAALLTNPVVLRAVAALGIGFAVLLWPNRTDRILARLVGLAFIWLAATAVYAALRQRPLAALNLVGAIPALAAGAFLVLTPDQSATFLGRVIGAVVLTGAVRHVIAGVRNAERRGWLAPTIAFAATGALLLLFPEEILAAATTVVAVAWIVLSLLVVIISLDARTTGTMSYSRAADLAGAWLRDRPKTADARQALYDKILYEGPNTQRRVIRFFTLMTFAAVIASMGVLTDSTAVVIGAMLIAPLMTPLMGMAISLVMGWPNRLARAALMAVGGIVLAIGIGALLGLVAPTVIDSATNSQIAGRSNPTILDLIIAVAAGGAGAYGLSRPDVSDSLPGVAIAISLVPPLSVVGITYSQGDWGAGHGALLLFTTNMVAILVVGGLTFVATGVTPIARVAESQHRVRTSLAAVATAAVIVISGLLLNGTETATNLFEQSRMETTVAGWLSDAPLHRLVSAHIDNDTVTAVVVGPSDGLPAVPDLADDLGAALSRTIEVDVRLIVEERLTATSD